MHTFDVPNLNVSHEFDAEKNFLFMLLNLVWVSCEYVYTATSLANLAKLRVPFVDIKILSYPTNYLEKSFLAESYTAFWTLRSETMYNPELSNYCFFIVKVPRTS